MSGNEKKTWEEQMKETADQIINRKPFEYDMNADKLYQQYKDAHIQQGKMAMEDTVGQASALTGGYGNSYAVTAGNQAYMGYMKELDNIAPSLYQAAMDRYVAEGDALNEKYDALAKLLGESTEDAEDFLGEDDIFTTYAEKLKNGEYESNDALADFLAKEKIAGNIDEIEETKLYDYFMDKNEIIGSNEKLSFSEMVRNYVDNSSKQDTGWKMADDGGSNLWGIDKDAKVVTPMGTTITLDELFDILVKQEGMEKKEAKKLIKKMQNGLGISTAGNR